MADHNHHLVYGRGMRELADKDRLTIPLCYSCHEKVHKIPELGAMSKILGQTIWEAECGEKNARELFIMRYGRSYL